MTRKDRLIVLLCLLTITMSGVAAGVSSKALSALGHFDRFLLAVSTLAAEREKENLAAQRKSDEIVEKAFPEGF